MPIYEYECKDGHRSERLRYVDKADEAVQCDQCKKIAKRVMSATKTNFRHNDRTPFK